MTDTSVDEISPLLSRSSRITEISDEQKNFQQKCSVWLILISAGFERLAFYSLAGNLVLFLTSNHIQWSSAHTLAVTLIFLGTSYTSALFFAWLSDGKFGRARTIILGFILYIIGYVFIVLFSSPKEYQIVAALCEHNSTTGGKLPFFLEPCIPQILSTFIVTSIGAGSVQVNMAIFGAEQIGDQKETRQYFDKYYAVVNAGGLISFAIIAYVQQNISYFYGYLIPAGFLILAFILFLYGLKFYTHIQPEDSLMSTFFSVIRNAFQMWRKSRTTTSPDSPDHEQNSSFFGLFRSSNQNKDLLSLTGNYRSKSFLDYAKISNQGKFLDRTVDDIKSIRRIIVVFLLLIPYSLVYIQIETSFLIQGLHMKTIEIKNQNFNHRMPIIWLSLTNQFIIILVLFLLNTFVYKRLKASGRSFTIRARVIIGMIFATIAMILAGTVEYFRQEHCVDSFIQTIGRTDYRAADMSIFYQFPQYIAVGLSEVFTSVASLEFAYLAAPPSAHSFIMSLRFCSAGISAFIGVLYIGVFSSIKEKISLTNLECCADKEPEIFYIYFYILASFQFVFMLIFILCDKKYKLLKAAKRRLTTRLFVG